MALSIIFYFWQAQLAYGSPKGFLDAVEHGGLEELTASADLGVPTG